MTRIAMHLVGASDIGLDQPSTGQFHARIGDLRRLDPADPDLDAALEGTPIARLLAGPGVDVLVLVVGPGGPRPPTEVAPILTPYARARVGHLDVVTVRTPSLAEGRRCVGRALHKIGDEWDRDVDWAVSFGSGSTAVVLGIVSELLLRGARFTVLPVDDRDTPLRLVPDTDGDVLRRWLVRHRAYAALAADPAWRPLANRQALDVDALLARVARRRSDGRWPLDGVTRRVLTEAVQAAFVEGLARGEATDAAAARTWARLFLPDPPATPAECRWVREVVRASHGAPFDPNGIPEEVRQRHRVWLRTEHSRMPLLPFPAWPTVAPPWQERRVVLLRPLRPEDDAADAATLADLAHVLESRDVRSYELRTAQCRQAASRSGITRVPVGVADGVQDSPSLAQRYRRALRERLDDDLEAELADEVAVLVPVGFKALSMAALLAAVDWSLHIAAPLTVLTFVPREREQQGTGRVDGLIIKEETRAFATLGLDRHLATLAHAALARLDLALAADLLGRGSRDARALGTRVGALRTDAVGVLPADGGTAEQTCGAEVALAPARLLLCRRIADGSPWNAAYRAMAVMEHTFRMPRDETAPRGVSGLGEVRPTETDGWLPVGVPPRGLRFEEEPDRLYLTPWHRLRTSGGAASRLRELRNGHPLAHGLDPDHTAIRAPNARAVRGDLDQAAADLCQELRRCYPGLRLCDTGELLTQLEELETEVARLH